MNFSTHVLVGAVLGLFVSLKTGNTEILVISGMLGGFLPELDFLFGRHRKTLHFPVLLMAPSIILGVLTALTNSMYGLVAFVFFLSVWLHPFMDIFAGAELKSWDKSEWKDTAVFNHLTGSWIEPRRIAYGGSVQDNLIAFCSFFLLFFLVENLVFRSIFVLLLISAVIYSIGIRRFAEKNVEEYDTLSQYFRAKMKSFFCLNLHS